MQLDRAADLEHELALQSSKIETLEGDADLKDATIAVLRGLADESKKRESELAAAEATLATRSAALDAREAAIKSTETTVAANTIPGDGTFVVGSDVQPGLYKSEGGSRCYWSRMNAAGDDTIDNYFGAGPAVLTIQSTDGLIKTSHCAPFTKVG